MMSILVAVLLSAGLLRPATTNEITTRVVVRGQSLSAASEAVKACGGVVESEIGIIDAVVASVPETCVDSLQRAPGVLLVSPDRAVELSASEVAAANSRRDYGTVNFTEVIGVEDVWESGNLGERVTVAILDTGVDPTFVELRRTQGERTRDRFLAYYDAIEERLYRHPRTLRSPRDANGHGTHVAGIIANGTYDGQWSGEYRGVAPAANLVAVRVLNEEGAGSYADVLKGIDWVVRNKDRYNIRVLNVSMYSIPVAPYWADPYNLAVMAAWEAGIVVVASAGNTGPEAMSVGVPGNTPYVITVGAFTDHRTPSDFGDDYIPNFSASGPTLDAFVKPDVIAPGAHVVSLMRPNAYLRELYPERRVNGRYFEMSGTSMSTAAVSGVAALILSENPDLTPDEVKFRLTQTARPQLNEAQDAAAYSIWQQGAGRVWAADAVMAAPEGAANQGMNLAADLAGTEHYQGWVTFDGDTGTFRVLGGGFDEWVAGYTTWDGVYHDWVDGYSTWSEGSTNWADSFDSWADSFDSWADSFDSWADSFDSWADSFDSWADSFDSWADTCSAGGSWRRRGSFDGWVDSFDSWADSFDSWADSFDSWADYAVWTDSFDSWADSFDSWADSYVFCGSESDSFDSWADSFDSWADAFVNWSAGITSVSDGLVAWSGGYSSWNGGYMTWSTSFDSWADSFDSWADGYGSWANLCGIDPDSFDSWADGQGLEVVSFDSWADSFDSWADSFDSWADSFDSWADYVAWSDSFDSWADSFDSWADSFDSWADGAVDETMPVSCGQWTSSFDSWADSFDSWADSFDSWADSFDSWADSFDSWADANANLVGELASWDGGYSSWLGGYAVWSGSFDSWADMVGSAEWAAAYANLTNLPTPVSTVDINLWVDFED
jgi:serine protease AprX